MNQKDGPMHGMKKVIESGDFKTPKTIAEWEWIIEDEEQLYKMLTLDSDWFRDAVSPRYKAGAKYMMKIMK